jgi:hypothetical protein
MAARALESLEGREALVVAAESALPGAPCSLAVGKVEAEAPQAQGRLRKAEVGATWGL